MTTYKPFIILNTLVVSETKLAKIFKLQQPINNSPGISYDRGCGMITLSWRCFTLNDETEGYARFVAAQQLVAESGYKLDWWQEDPVTNPEWLSDHYNRVKVQKFIGVMVATIRVRLVKESQARGRFKNIIYFDNSHSADLAQEIDAAYDLRDEHRGHLLDLLSEVGVAAEDVREIEVKPLKHDSGHSTAFIRVENIIDFKRFIELLDDSEYQVTSISLVEDTIEWLKAHNRPVPDYPHHWLIEVRFWVILRHLRKS